METQLDPMKDDLPLMANTSYMLLKHYILDLDVDFKSKVIEGIIVLFFETGSRYRKTSHTDKDGCQSQFHETCEMRASELCHIPVTNVRACSSKPERNDFAVCGKGEEDTSDKNGNHSNEEQASGISSSKDCCDIENHGNKDFLLVLDCCDLSVLKVEEVDVAAVSGIEKFTRSAKLTDVSKELENLRNQIVHELVTLPADRWKEQLYYFTRCSQAPGCGELLFTTGTWSLEIRKSGIQTPTDFPHAIRIWYKTKPEGRSVTWTTDQSGRPCVYTMGSPINNRALFPCQEPPVALSTWQASVRTAAGFVVLMSGENSAEPVQLREGILSWYYYVTMPMPASTFTIAVGCWREVKQQSFTAAIQTGIEFSLPSSQADFRWHEEICGHVEYPCRFQNPAARLQAVIPYRVFAPWCLMECCEEHLLQLIPQCLSAAYITLGTHPFSRLDVLIVPSNFSSLGMARCIETARRQCGERPRHSCEIDPHAGPVVLDEKLASRCGYVLSEDVWGNPVFRASVLGCHVANEADELFSLTVNIKVSSFSSMRAAVTYTYPMYCSYASWASREIVCEENYMEVSVKTDVPAVSNDYTVAWMSALPETQNVAYQLWQLMFVSPSGRKRITVSDAAKLGYSFNNTLSRVYLRAPYHSNESDVSVVSGVNMNMVTSTSMYRQRWLLLLIDTTVSCPVDGISFTDTTLTWTVPSVIPTLVLQESTFLSKNILMGVDDRVIVNPEEKSYLLEHNETHIRITIPIGAEGGQLKSSISSGVYGVIYSIDLFLEHTWTDADWQTTKYTVIKSITTPFMPQIPTVINNTLPEERLFNVAFGHFLPDVSLVAIAIGNVPFTLREALHHGFKIYETPFSNRTKRFILELSFDDPYVLKEYVNRNETKYTLLVNYTISVGPEMTLYYHSAEVECVIADIELPEAVGYCDEENLYLAIPTFGLHQYWNLYLGNKLLNRHVALINGYLAATNSTHLILQIPLFAAGVIYEDVSFQKIKARFDVALRKVRTMETLQMFSVSCRFNSSAFIICHPDGTITVSAQMKTVPAIDMSKTKLRHSSCKPREYNEGHAFFKFHVTTCGTSVRFEGDHIIYENEISYEKETLPGQSIPTITRDPDYRLTVLCYYRAKETLVLGAFASDPSTSPPFGSGTMVPRSNIAVYRRIRQALNVVSRVSKDESFVEFHEPNMAILKRSVEPVFLEVELKDQSPDTELYLENCWVTRSLDSNSTPRWNITVDGCEVHGSEYIAEFCPVAVSPRVRHPSHFKRLAVRTLAHRLEQAYVHCLVAACSPTSILPGSPGRGQCSSSREQKAFPGHCSANLQGYVLAGPVWIVDPHLR